jgi:ElaB/YqjD/DUF883 family membrane-anchored ribosome-binding protein
MKPTPPPSASIAPDELLQELEGIIAQAEKLLGGTAEGPDEKKADAHQRLTELVDSVRTKVRQGAQRADATVKAHPYLGLAIALGLGAVIGVLLTRRGAPLGQASDAEDRPDS